jgi:hypothetical protein
MSGQNSRNGRPLASLGYGSHDLLRGWKAIGEYLGLSASQASVWGRQWGMPNFTDPKGCACSTPGMILDWLRRSSSRRMRSFAHRDSVGRRKGKKTNPLTNCAPGCTLDRQMRTKGFTMYGPEEAAPPPDPLRALREVIDGPSPHSG